MGSGLEVVCAKSGARQECVARRASQVRSAFRAACWRTSCGASAGGLQRKGGRITVLVLVPVLLSCTHFSPSLLLTGTQALVVRVSNKHWQVLPVPILSVSESSPFCQNAAIRLTFPCLPLVQ